MLVVSVVILGFIVSLHGEILTLTPLLDLIPNDRKSKHDHGTKRTTDFYR